MRSFVSVFVVFTMLFVGLGAIAQSPGESAGSHNIVTVTARHCDKYSAAAVEKYQTPWAALPSDLKRPFEEACSKDDSAIFYQDKGHNLVTNGGISWRALVMGQAVPASSGVGAYLALTADVTAPSAAACAYFANAAAVTAADCALGTGEYITVGLNRALSTFAYAGAATYTLDKTWTCVACSASVVAASGVYDRAYGTPKGVLIWWYKFASSVTLNGTDQVQVTWTITLT